MRLFDELKRRNVFRVAAAYGVAAWLVIQVSDLVFPRLALPDWTVTFVILVALLGFPLALVLAWAYELTPDGIRRSKDVEDATGTKPARKRPIDFAIIMCLVLVIALLLAERIWLAGTNGVAADDRSLVVLPFANLSDDPANVYFADGLSEELMNVLAQAPTLRVIGRTSSFYWKGRNEDLRTIGQTLGVAHLLEGSVRRQGNQVRITAQLVRASDGMHEWSQKYDRSLDDVFAIQDDIAANVLHALEIVLDESQRQRMQNVGVRDVEAFVAYQKGYELWDRAHESGSIAEGLVEVHGHFATAIARVPKFSAAHFLDADFYIHRLAAAPGFLTRAEQEQSLVELRRSLDAAYESSADPLRRAIIDVDRTLFSDDWTRLRERIDRALTEPGCARTLLLESAVMFGYAKRLEDLYRREAACDPLFRTAWWDAAGAALWAGDHDVAIELLDEGERKVGDEPRFSAARAITLLAMGRTAEARAAASGVATDQDIYGLVVHAGLLAAANELDAALEKMDEIAAQRTAGAIDARMLVYAMVGDRNRANEQAAEIDARPGGPAVITMWINVCACGLPFEMDATPNLKARIAEAGVPWPPPTIVRYPAKDW